MNTLKTIKQIADELEIDKQKVYRYIKRNRINEAHQVSGVMHYDESAQMLIKNYFSNKIASNEVLRSTSFDAENDTIILFLRQQLETKDEQIREKDLQLKAKDEQIASLHRIMEQQNTLAMADKPTMYQLASGRGGEDQTVDQDEEPKKWYHFWK